MLEAVDRPNRRNDAQVRLASAGAGLEQVAARARTRHGQILTAVRRLQPHSGGCWAVADAAAAVEQLGLRLQYPTLPKNRAGALPAAGFIFESTIGGALTQRVQRAVGLGINGDTERYGVVAQPRQEQLETDGNIVAQAPAPLRRLALHEREGRVVGVAYGLRGMPEAVQRNDHGQ